MSLTTRKYLFAFIMITSLFFLWGFVHNFNPVLIPHLKRSFTLNTTQSTLIDTAVYAAYFLMAIPAGMLMKRFGYKVGIITGLLVFAMGAFLFIPAANLQSYLFFLAALFVIATGLTMLETAANPYASALGDPATAPMRLNFSQSFNGLAAALAPAIGVRVILTETHTDEQLAAMTEAARTAALASEASSVKIPYLILGLALVVVAIIFSFLKLPKIQQDAVHHHGSAGSQEQSTELTSTSTRKGPLSFRHLRWAIVTQFFYVGAQVCVFSTFLLYAPVSAGITQKEAGDYLFICGMAFLAGRFIGTALMQYFEARKLLMLYAIMSFLLGWVAVFASGMITIYTVVGICFFMSIMFPTIFALGIRNLKQHTEFGSSLIIMAIVGAALLPLLFGLITDLTGNVQLAYLVPIFCFAVVWYFGWKGADE
ncbi:MAG: L-fucose:H+ symporter permease [Chitinophagaceae bacterium]|nr:L-fucose:H+ symporter permease [Chitinophagaceae bacterium]